MPAELGRNIRIERSANGSPPWTVIAGARSDKLSIKRDTADISSKDLAGWRALLGAVPNVAVDMTVEGVLNDTTLLDQAFDPDTALFNFRITFGAFNKTATGLWALSNFDIDANNNQETLFTAQIMSSGVITWADAA